MVARRRRQKKNFLGIKAFQIFILLTFFVAGSIFLSQKTYEYFHHAELFNIKHIEKTPSLQFVQSSYLERLKGHNIFSVDLEAVQQRIQSKYPEIAELRIQRKFPDTLYLSAKKREPFAFVTLQQQDVLLDQEGYVLSFKPLPVSQLPQIMGVKVREALVIGKPLRSRSLQRALRILTAFAKVEALSSLKVLRIHVENPSKIQLETSEGFMVILDEQDVPLKMQTFAALWEQQHIDAQTIGYIDLRFQQPILGKKSSP